MNSHIYTSIINYIRITQILIEKGWKLIDNGYPKIEMAINESNNEKVVFENDYEFILWLSKFDKEIN